MAKWIKNVICHYEKTRAVSAKFTEAQIAFALKESETGTRVEEICRQLDVSKPHSLIGKRSTEEWVLLSFVNYDSWKKKMLS